MRGLFIFFVDNNFFWSKRTRRLKYILLTDKIMEYLQREKIKAHLIELPNESLLKIVQLDINGLPYLAFGAFETYHKNILEQKLIEMQLPYKIVELPSSERGPELEGERYSVVGMGICQRHENKIDLIGNSTDYKIKINKEHFQRCIPYIKDSDSFVFRFG